MGISSVLGTGALVPAGYGFRNLIINGAMQVAQRGTSASSKTTSGYYTADRWNFEVGSIGTWTQSVENDAPTGSGFRKSLKMLCTSATASPAAGGYCLIGQRFEGQNLQSIKKGTSSAERVTLTFWVKSNVTGTYIAELYDNDNTRQASASYTVSASATWEKKTIVFPADTTGAFDNDNAYSLSLFMHLAAGSNYTSGTLNTVWASATAANRVVGQTNVAAATNNYWQITGVQMEVGPVATAYEFRPHEIELAQCQRYYYRRTSTADNPYCIIGQGLAYLSTIVQCDFYHPVPMRARCHTLDTSSVSNMFTENSAGDSRTPSAITFSTNVSTELVTRLDLTVSGATQSRGYASFFNNTSGGYVGVSAEL